MQFDIDNPTSDRPAPWDANIDRASRLIDQAVLRHGPPKLVVLPAYSVTGIPQAMATGPKNPGREFALSDAAPLKELARRLDAYVVVGAVEYDDAEARWWNAAYILDPSGEIGLHYRQVHAPGQPGLGDVGAPSADAELRTVFPVFDSEIGKLGCAVGIDALAPELARSLTFNGVEIVCHLTDDPPTFFRDGARHVRLARAWENTIYWISADHGHGGTTEIIGPDARGIAASQGPGESVTAAHVDLERLRTMRAAPRATNFILALRTPLYVGGHQRAAERSPRPDDKPPVAPYGIACFQTELNTVTDLTRRDEILRQNLDRSTELLAWGTFNSKIVVFPEFWLQGYHRDFMIDDFRALAFSFDGWEMDRLREAARRHQIYLTGCIWEKDADWPGIVFNTGFILDPSGELALRYRKVNCLNLAGALADTTPGDIYTDYVKKHGHDALFPVIDTPLGVLGVIVSFDVHYPEQTAQLALKGAEVILHTSAEVQGGNRHGWQAARRARAIDNIAYLASANSGGDVDRSSPRHLHHGHSQLIDYNGNVMAIVEGGGESVVSAQIDIMALRRRRATDPNWLKTGRSDLWTKLYAENEGCPTDLFLNEPLVDKTRGPAILKENLDRLYARDVFVAPEHMPEAPKRAI